MDNNYNYGQNNGSQNGYGQATDYAQNGYGQTTDYSQNGYGQTNDYSQNGYGQMNDYSQNAYGQTTDYSQNAYGQPNGYGQTTTDYSPNGYGQTNGYAQNGFGQTNTYQNTGYGQMGGSNVRAVPIPVSENVVKGIIGSLIGTALGVVVWLLIASLGYISWIGGFAISAGAFYGYFLMGKGMSKSGMTVVVAMVLVAVWFATKMSWAIEFQKAFKDLGENYTVGECWKNMSTWFAIAGGKGEFTADLVLGYVFTALGAFSVYKKFKK